MTEKQYEEYKELNDEVEKLKLFLFHCGKRYRYQSFCIYYLFNLLPMAKISKRFKFSDRFKLYIKGVCWSENDKSFDISKDLHDRIIDVIEEYVDEKEEEMRKI